jgi:hypothetical protein
MSALSMLSGCLVLLAGSGLPLEETTEVEAAVEAEAEPELLAWSDLQRDAARHMGRVRRVIVQFHELQEQWNPFLTRFGPSDYFALGAWSDEQRPWRRAEWEAPAVRAFMQRGTLLAAYLRAGRPHQRFMLTVVVREHCAVQVTLAYHSPVVPTRHFRYTRATVVSRFLPASALAMAHG